MSLEKITEHSFKEMKTHVIDKALFGVKNKLIAVVSWIDLAKAKLPRDYSGALQFIFRYVVPTKYKPQVESFAKVLQDNEMKHPCDNAFRVEMQKPYGYEQILRYGAY